MSMLHRARTQHARKASVRAATDVVAVSLSREDIFSAVSSDKIAKMRSIARTQVFNQIPMLSLLDTSLKVGGAGGLGKADDSRERAKIPEVAEELHAMRLESHPWRPQRAPMLSQVAPALS